MKNQYRSWILALVITLSGLTSPLVSMAAVSSGTLIKGQTSSAVYYVEAGKRYAFPNDKVFLSWYTNFSGVVTVPDSELASYSLAGNVTYRPGVYLIKIATDPKVYAVSKYGVLHWVKTETLTAELFGTEWNTKVHDVSDAFFSNYLIGAEINSASEYNRAEETAVIAISLNIRPVDFTLPTPIPAPATPSSKTPLLSVTVSTSQATLNQIVLVFATVADATNPISKIDMYSDQDSAVLATCLNTATCGFNYTVKQAPLTIRFRAVATDNKGNKIDTPVDQQASLNVAAVSSNIQMSATPQEAPVGTRISYSSDAGKISGITSHKIFVVIPGEPNPVLWKDCGVERICASSSPFYRTSQLYSKVAFNGTIYQSASVTVNIIGGEPPKPKLILVSKPNPSQAVLKLEAPNVETVGWSTIVVGSKLDDYAIAICEFTICEVTVQFTKPQTYTAFTDIGGKPEASNSISVSP